MKSTKKIRVKKIFIEFDTDEEINEGDLIYFDSQSHINIERACCVVSEGEKFLAFSPVLTDYDYLDKHLKNLGLDLSEFSDEHPELIEKFESIANDVFVKGKEYYYMTDIEKNNHLSEKEEMLNIFDARMPNDEEYSSYVKYMINRKKRQVGFIETLLMMETVTKKIIHPKDYFNLLVIPITQNYQLFYQLFPVYKKKKDGSKYLDLIIKRNLRIDGSFFSINDEEIEILPENMNLS
jgi:hypothetical protein